MKPIISPNIRIRYPEFFEVGAYSIIDDFSYFSTRVRIGQCSHVANNCSIAGGSERTFSLGDFSTVSAGVRIWCSSDHFRNDLVVTLPPGVPSSIKSSLISGDVSFGHYTAIGSNTVVMPKNTVPEGVAIGALSFVPANFAFEPWGVYAGTPVKRVAERAKDELLRQAAILREAMEKQ